MKTALHGKAMKTLADITDVEEMWDYMKFFWPSVIIKTYEEDTPKTRVVDVRRDHRKGYLQ